MALWVLTLFEILVRHGREQQGEKLPGLYPDQTSRTTDRPTASRVLAATARAGITVTLVDDGDDRRWHLTPLSKLMRRVLASLGLTEAEHR